MLATFGLIAAFGGCAGGDADGVATTDSAAGDSAGRQPAPARPLIPSSDSGSASSADRPATTGRADSVGTPASSPGGLGRWDVAALEKRLDLQGMAPRKQPAPVRHSFLAVEGASYLVGNAELQVFIYDDSAAVTRDVAKLDTIAVAPRGGKVKWANKPTLIRNNNLLAILLGQNALQIERVQRALMAGLSPVP